VITPDSIFNGRPNANWWCIGIEFSRNVQNNNIMPEAQVAAGVRLVADIKRRYPGIKTYTHDQFNVGRTCPGPNFPLSRFLNA
jgi:N-acetyl-anhydromuramyl-L-alanine amidase AmpD